MIFDRIIAVRNNKTIYRDGNTVLKVFDESYTKADVLNEAYIQSQVENTSLSIPKILSVGSNGSKWYIESEYIPGKTLAQLMAEHPSEKDKFLRLFVDLQMDMHAKSCPNLRVLKEKISRRIDETALDALTKHTLHARLEVMPEHRKLCHGDFNPSNIIIRDDGKPYILDWSHAALGNASADAARSYLLFRLNGEADEAETYLKLFCEKSGTEPKYVRRWMPIVAAAQMVKGNERERDFLISQIDVTEYE